MRVRLRDDLRTLRRPGGVAALGAALGGLVALWSPTAPAWTLVATVDALGTSDRTAVAVRSGLETTVLAGVAWPAGVVVLVVATLVALDRPPPLADGVLTTCAVVMLAATTAVLVARPTTGDFVAHDRAGALVGAHEALPTGITIELGVRPAAGPVLLGVAALAVVFGTVLATRHA